MAEGVLVGEAKSIVEVMGELNSGLDQSRVHDLQLCIVRESYNMIAAATVSGPSKWVAEKGYVVGWQQTVIMPTHRAR